MGRASERGSRVVDPIEYVVAAASVLFAVACALGALGFEVFEAASNRVWAARLWWKGRGL